MVCEKRILISSLWCPLVIIRKDNYGVSMKGRDKGLLYPQMKEKGHIGRANDKCPKYNVFICSNILNVGSMCGTTGGLLKKSCRQLSRRICGLKISPFHSCGKSIF